MEPAIIKAMPPYFRFRESAFVDGGDALVVRAPIRALLAQPWPSDSVGYPDRCDDSDGDGDGGTTFENDPLYAQLRARWEDPSTPSRLDQAASLLAGTVTLVAARTLSAPLSQFRVRCQLETGGPRVVVSVLRQVVGPASAASSWDWVFRGATANVLRCVPEYGVRLCFHRVLLAGQSSVSGNSVSRVVATDSLVYASTVAGLAQAAAHPLHVAHVRMALAPPGFYGGVAACLHSIPRDSVSGAAGKGLTRGMGASVVAAAVGGGVEVVAVHSLRVVTIVRVLVFFRLGKAAYADADARVAATAVTPWPNVAAAAIAGTTVYPLSVVRTRLIAQGLPLPASGSLPESSVQRCATYRSTWACVRGVYREAGVRGFYRGWTASVLGWAFFGYASFQAYHGIFDRLRRAHGT